MSRATFRRLAVLEAKQPTTTQAVHQIIIEEDEDEAPRIAALIAAGARETDLFIVRRIVSPPAREAA